MPKLWGCTGTISYGAQRFTPDVDGGYDIPDKIAHLFIEHGMVGSPPAGFVSVLQVVELETIIEPSPDAGEVEHAESPQSDVQPPSIEPAPGAEVSEPVPAQQKRRGRR
jgi:hypothetical protein